MPPPVHFMVALEHGQLLDWLECTDVRRIMGLWLELRQRARHGEKAKRDVLWPSTSNTWPGTRAAAPRNPAGPGPRRAGSTKLLKITRGVRAAGSNAGRRLDGPRS